MPRLPARPADPRPPSPVSSGPRAGAPPPVLVLVSTEDDPQRLAEVVGRVADAASLRVVGTLPGRAPETAATPPAVTVLTPGAVAWFTAARWSGTRAGLLPGEVAVLAGDADDAVLLHRALALGCTRVLAADDELGLLEHVREARDAAARAAAPRGRVVGVRPATGGAGASCLAAALALGAPGPVVLIDADVAGAGLEPLLGDRWTGPGAAGRGGAGRGGAGAGGEVPGWARLAELEGQVDPALLVERLPVDRNVRLVGHGAASRTEPPASRLVQVVDAAARAGATVFVDLPSTPRTGEEPPLDEELLVVPCTVPGVVAAAHRVAPGPGLAASAPVAPARGWVVARRARAGLHPEEVSEALGIPLLADARVDHRLDEHVALGLGVVPRRRDPWSRTARRCLVGLDLPGGRP